ncbi:biliverdin-producing heme oxygenase [Denitrobaculum tricleocarpae]|uniref:Biliverdin-producing heme oxygenase n=1 Tax=Denitrobaculum tricleocarpae TaxID=2591009 RepID=A0A545SYP6_9PROT|nr:biliverdin-producing heme oxygenase [Denitrobaculum tricleocarpae]TQV70078.1 biliverdin-producing heme oxygenase [Denitrobaculum tricleocarpae]
MHSPDKNTAVGLSTKHRTNCRAWLRGATQAEHARLDRLVSRWNFAEKLDYSNFLLMQSAVLIPLESWLESRDVEADLPDWRLRARSTALLKDLATLNLSALPPVAMSFDVSLSAKMGILYVLEGSRLGGRVLARAVEGSLEPLPVSFLLHGSETGLWQSFRQRLGQLPHDPRLWEEMAQAARKVFELYEHQTRAMMKEAL